MVLLRSSAETEDGRDDRRQKKTGTLPEMTEVNKNGSLYKEVLSTSMFLGSVSHVYRKISGMGGRKKPAPARQILSDLSAKTKPSIVLHWHKPASKPAI